MTKPKSYLLVLVGELTEEIAKEVALSITPLVDSPQLKFQRSPCTTLFHFATEVDFNELKSFLDISLYGYSQYFILTEMNDRVGINMPKRYMTHLMDLESDKGSDLKIKSSGEQVNLTEDEDDEIDENEMALILNTIKNNIPSPSLDSLLDKIKKKGINSLSQYEKDVLEEYSNQI